MKGFILGFMNFSVINKSGKGFKERRKNYEEYKKSILDPKRLALREKIFFDNTVPLFIDQHYKLLKKGVFFKFSVAISNQLPSELIERFDQLVKMNKDVFEVYKVDEEESHSWLDVLQSQVELLADSLIVTSQEEIIVSNFRLDDDDLLSQDYFSQQVKYLKSCYEGFYLTFPKGYVGVFEDGYEEFYSVNKPFLSIGLSRVSKFSVSEMKFVTEKPCVLAAGSHAKLINNCVSILDSSFVAFVWTMHVYSDTRSVDGNEKSSKIKIQKIISDQNLKKVSFEEVRDSFLIANI